MGSCVSVHKNPDSAMKVRLGFGSSKPSKFVSPSPTKENPVNGEYSVADLGFKPQHPIQNFGSKEEAFFDSQPWLESDCDDDFFSVKGDFTPSRGNTPNYQSNFVRTPSRGKAFVVESAKEFKPEPSPNTKKKKLSELFQESFAGDVSDDQNIGVTNPGVINLDLSQKSTNGTPNISGVSSVCNSESVPNAPKAESEKLSRAVQCCLPSFGQSRSSIDRKKTLSPGDNVFKYSPGLHSVVELSSEKEYSGCDISNAVNSMSAGNDAVKLSKEGTRYFACGTPGHCGQGMKLKVKTVGANAAPTQDSSSKPSSTSASTSPVLKSVTSFVALVVCTVFGFLNFI
ncbi:hypothetical protein Sjap_023322 [Stephania japonica]|uniref:Phytocyanin domain-containing protein n=1 Tax=Stephania japonica TaxID=461633 RepID=A0AAP0EBE7_9MAGN